MATPQGPPHDGTYVESYSKHKIRPLVEAITTAATGATNLKTNNDGLVAAMVACKEEIVSIDDLKAFEELLPQTSA